ncbi:MAG: hypothetical protein SFV15_11450 [Polyangiaceae bacterium]|nr:hypothetical protein [Polyangiaceae bacterium]
MKLRYCAIIFSSLFAAACGGATNIEAEPGANTAVTGSGGALNSPGGPSPGSPSGGKVNSAVGGKANAAGPGPTPSGITSVPATSQECGVSAQILARRIAYDSDALGFNRDIFISRADGSERVRVTDYPSAETEPNFSPDGASLVFTSDMNGQPQIFLLHLASGSLSQLTSRPEGADQAGFSRDGRFIAFHSGASVYVIGVDGLGERLIATGLDTFNAYFWPEFSADGEEVLFDRNNELNAARLDNLAIRPVVQNSTTTIKMPAVSPDGREVAYSVNCSTGFAAEGASIWTTPYGTATAPCDGRRVTPQEPFSLAKPAWATVDVLAYERIDTANNLARIAVTSRAVGSVPCLVTPADADYRNPNWAPEP